jgi:HPt (histidine-containing phosphotransfer) domain-containing protein
MERALEHSDFEALRQTAHQLKGSGGGYGYPKLSEKAATLERYARFQALHECNRALDDLRNLCARIMSAED